MERKNSVEQMRGHSEHPQSSLTVFTVGHGSRSSEELMDILHGAGITCVADVRSYPVSRRYPVFSRTVLAPRLDTEGIHYHWLGKPLGGFRKPSSQSPHVALRNAGLRGFAEYMCGENFLHGITELLRHVRQGATAILCAERLPQDCHRGLISDHLVAQDIDVIHLLEPDLRVLHRLNPLARPQSGRLIYDAGSVEQLALGL